MRKLVHQCEASAVTRAPRIDEDRWWKAICGLVHAEPCNLVGPEVLGEYDNALALHKLSDVFDGPPRHLPVNAQLLCCTYRSHPTLAQRYCWHAVIDHASGPSEHLKGNTAQGDVRVDALQIACSEADLLPVERHWQRAVRRPSKKERGANLKRTRRPLEEIWRRRELAGFNFRNGALCDQQCSGEVCLRHARRLARTHEHLRVEA